MQAAQKDRQLATVDFQRQLAEKETALTAIEAVWQTLTSQFNVLAADKKSLESDRQTLETRLDSLQTKLAEQQTSALAIEDNLQLQLQQAQTALTAASLQGKENLGQLRALVAEKSALAKQLETLTAEKTALSVPLGQRGHALQQAQQKNEISTADIPPQLAAKKSALPRVEVEQPKLAPPEPAQDVSAIERVVKSWSKAWSEQNVDAYLSFYSPDFDPRGPRSRASWENQRRTKLKRPKFIIVSLQDIKIDIVNPNTSRINFTQSFKSNTYGDKVTKQLEMKKEHGEWRIVSEEEIKPNLAIK